MLGLEVRPSFVAGCVWVSPYLLTAFSVGSRQDASHSAVANHANQIWHFEWAPESVRATDWPVSSVNNTTQQISTPAQFPNTAVHLEAWYCRRGQIELGFNWALGKKKTQHYISAFWMAHWNAANWLKGLFSILGRVKAHDFWNISLRLLFSWDLTK